MDNAFVQAKNGEFTYKNKKIILRGFNIGTWMNIENFMIRIPGTEKRIKEAFTQIYGKENAGKFFDDFLKYFITEDDFKFIKSMGINVLRLALNYRHFEDDQSPGEYKKEGFKHLDRILELCRKYNIFAILDMHSAPGGQNPDYHSTNETGVAGFWDYGSLRDRIINLWGYIADRYKEESIIAGYDLLNEPALVSDIDAFNDFFEKVIRKIRAVDNNHILFLEGDDWAKDFSLFKNLGGYQQAISFHFYPGQHVNFFDDPAKRKTEMENKISYFISLREKTGMPLWVGETGGLFPKEKMPEGIVLIKDCIDIFEKNNISWTIWAYKDAKSMGLVYPKENTKWMILGNYFRSKWQTKEFRSDAITKEIFKLLENKFSYSINNTTKNKLAHRISSMLNELHIDYLVKPKLQSISWDEIKKYPESFLWDNCDYWKKLADIVKSYTA